MLSVLILAFAALFFISAPARAANFDCTGARHPVERMICGDPSLSALDDRLARVYSTIASSSNPPAQLRADQDRWLAQRNRCTNTACVANIYQARLAQLDAAARAASPPGPFPEPATRPGPAADRPGGSQSSGNPQQQSTRPQLDAETFVLPDRMIWESRSPCDPGRSGPPSVSTLVAMGTSLKDVHKAYVFVGDGFSTNSMAAFPTIPTVAEYASQYDDIVDSLKLTYTPSMIMQSGPSKTLEAVFDNQQSLAKMRLSQSCDVTLYRKSYPASFIELMTRVKTESTFTPPFTLTSAKNGDEACLALAAWVRDVKNGAGNRTFARPIQPSDSDSQMFLASVFHQTFTRPYLGRDVGQLDQQVRDDVLMTNQWKQRTRACVAHPLFFEDQAIVTNVFLPIIGNVFGGRAALSRLSDIQGKINRIMDAGSRFSQDPAGLARFREYIAPLEAELATALPQVRDAMLGPMQQREGEIALAILQKDSDTQGEVRPIEQLAGMDDTVRSIRAGNPPVQNSAPALAKAEESIGRELSRHFASEQRGLQDIPATSDGLARFTAQRAELIERYRRFSSYAPYKLMMTETAEQENGIVLGILRQEMTNRVEIGSVDQLAALQDTIRMVKARNPAVPDSGPLLTRADEILVQGLRDRLVEEESAVRDLPGTPDGLVRLAAWRAAMSEKYRRFASYAPYEQIAAQTAARETALLRSVAKDFEEKIAAAPDVAAIRQIKQLLEAAQRDIGGAASGQLAGC